LGGVIHVTIRTLSQDHQSKQWFADHWSGQKAE